MDYTLEIASEGRSGTVRYSEQGQALEFWWEFTTDGAAINIPRPENWNSHCERSGTSWAVDRRDEIIRRIGEETRDRQASSATLEYEDEWIVLKF